MKIEELKKIKSLNKFINEFNKNSINFLKEYIKNEETDLFIDEHFSNSSDPKAELYGHQKIALCFCLTKNKDENLLLINTLVESVFKAIIDYIFNENGFNFIGFKDFPNIQIVKIGKSAWDNSDIRIQATCRVIGFNRDYEKKEAA